MEYKQLTSSCRIIWLGRTVFVEQHGGQSQKTSSQTTDIILQNHLTWMYSICKATWWTDQKTSSQTTDIILQSHLTWTYSICRATWRTEPGNDFSKISTRWRYSEFLVFSKIFILFLWSSTKINLCDKWIFSCFVIFHELYCILYCFPFILEFFGFYITVLSSSSWVQIADLQSFCVNPSFYKTIWIQIQITKFILPPSAHKFV